MDALTQLISQKTGISQEQAKTAVTTVLSFLKDKLPAPIASQVENAVMGKGLQEVAAGLGGLLGKK